MLVVLVLNDSGSWCTLLMMLRSVGGSLFVDVPWRIQLKEGILHVCSRGGLVRLEGVECIGHSMLGNHASTHGRSLVICKCYPTCCARAVLW